MDPTDTLNIFPYFNALQPRSGGGDPHKTDARPPVYKAVGISLAIASGLFIGTSFVLKKTGLLRANIKYNEEAGEGYGYLKNAYWWSGMTLMILGEICNFVAYAFVDAILVTPLGALSVVITTILSAIFLKERLSFVGKIGCFMCIIGSVVIVMNAPEQAAATTIQEMKKFVLAPGFLSYAGVIIVGCAFIALWAGPRYGKKSMLVYLTVCSLVGGLSVVATQGLGAAVVAQAAGKPQFNQWFLYVLFVFVVATLLTEIVFLNKALNIFNAALVTPTYYVYFTSSTIVTSAILFQGFKGTPTSIITVVMGFLVICSGVVLLQLSKSAKDVPDAAVFKGDLDQVRTVAEQEEPESEPKADAIRGTAAIIRRISQSRQKMEAAEAKRVHEERMRDQMEPIRENEQVEWDGLRRRKTVVDGPGGITRRKTLHPPLGMTHFPQSNDDSDHDHGDISRPPSTDVHGGSGIFHGSFFNSFRRHNQRNDSLPAHSRTLHKTSSSSSRTDLPQRPFTEIVVSPTDKDGALGTDTAYHPPTTSGSMEMDHVYGLPASLARSPSATESTGRKPIVWAQDVSERPSTGKSSNHLAAPAPTPPPHQPYKRQFSFQNVFSRHRGNTVTSMTSSTDGAADDVARRGGSSHGHVGIPSSPRKRGLGGSRGSDTLRVGGGVKSTATEEERLGLVKGDTSETGVNLPEYCDQDDGGKVGWDYKSKGEPEAGVEANSGSSEGESSGEKEVEKKRDMLPRYQSDWRR